MEKIKGPTKPDRRAIIIIYGCISDDLAERWYAMKEDVDILVLLIIQLQDIMGQYRMLYLYRYLYYKEEIGDECNAPAKWYTHINY